MRSRIVIQMTKRDGYAYEDLVSGIFENIQKAEQREIENLGKGQGNTERGKSGQNHQIDVSFIDKSFNDTEETIVLIECKCQKDEITPNNARAIAYNARDIREVVQEKKPIMMY